MPSPKNTAPSNPLKSHGSAHQRGGTRPGAGRKSVDPRFKKVPVGLKLPQWMSDNLVALSREMDAPVSRLIEGAIAFAYKFRPPKP